MNKFLYKLQRKFIRGGENIDYNTMKKMLRENPSIIVIDVRTRDEYMYNHLDGAINIPMQDIGNKIGNVSKNKNDVFILYCEYGGRSIKALNRLKKMGYVNVYNLDGGIESI